MIGTEEKVIRAAEMRRSYRALLEEAKAFYKNKENVQAYEAWLQKEEKRADQH